MSALVSGLGDPSHNRNAPGLRQKTLRTKGTAPRELGATGGCLETETRGARKQDRSEESEEARSKAAAQWRPGSLWEKTQAQRRPEGRTHSGGGRAGGHARGEGAGLGQDEG